MIDEGTLAHLLSEHAMGIPVPESAVGDLLAAAPHADPSALSRFTRPSGRVLAAAALVTLIGAAGVWGLAAHHRDGESVNTRAAAATGQSKTLATGAGGAGRSGLTPTAPATHSSDRVSAGVNQQYSAASPTAPGTAATGSADAANRTAAAPKDNARVIRTGTVDLRIKRHTFGQTIGRITTIAAGAGGFISDEKTYESAAVPSGTVTLRVPSARFNGAVEKLRALGTVVSASTRGVDVTAEYVDLGARISAATATRDQYLTVLQHATNIGDILSVQDRIQTVQTQIDQLQGQRNLLDNETTYGTITTSVSEPTPKPKPAVRPHHEAGVSVAWGKAQHGFSQRIEGIISHSGSALVVIVGLLLLALAARLLVPRVRRLVV